MLGNAEMLPCGSFRLTLYGERSVSWNTYLGKHWRTRQKEAIRVKNLVRSIVLSSLSDFEIFDTAVDISVTVRFKSRPQDCSNICEKYYEDALIGLLVEDDSPEFVRSSTTISLLDRDNPCVEVTLAPCNVKKVTK